MLYFVFLLMIVCGFLDGLVKLYSPSFKTTRDYPDKSLLDFLLGK